METGDYLAKYRKDVGYNQVEVSEAIGLSRMSYTNIENNRQKISIETLIRLSNVLGFPISDFIEKVYGVPTPTSIKDAKLQRLESQKQKIIEEINELKKE